MTQITVATGFNLEGYELYGRKFLHSFEQYWPKDVGLRVFAEHYVPMARGELTPIVACSGLRDFLDRHRDNQRANGRTSRGYDFRFDAVKFCKQLFYPERAAQDLPDGSILVWLDADVVTFAPVPALALIDGLLGTADVAYLGRDKNHSEIGFWAVRLGPTTREFLAALADCYRSERVFKLREWHSAFVFDHVREQFSHVLSFGNCTPGGKNHVWFQCELGKYTDHLKGPRKLKGRSPERPAA